MFRKMSLMKSVLPVLFIGLMCAANVGVAGKKPFSTGAFNKKRSCGAGGIYSLVSAPSSGATYPGDTTGDTEMILGSTAGGETLAIQDTNANYCGYSDTNFPTSSTYNEADGLIVAPNANIPGQFATLQYFRDTLPTSSSAYSCVDLLNSGATCCVDDPNGGTCNVFFWKIYTVQ